MNNRKIFLLAISLLLTLSIFAGAAVADRQVIWKANYAYFDDDGNFVETSDPVEDFSVLGYVCSDSGCSHVSSSLWGGSALNSGYNGNDNQVLTTFPTDLQSSYGYGLYFYKPGYIVWEQNPNFWGTYSGDPVGPYTIYLSKASVCRAPVENFQVVNDVQPNVPLVIGVSGSLDSSVYSAMQNSGPLGYTPGALEDYYSFTTRVTLQIVRLYNNEVVYEAYRNVDVPASGSYNVEFTWTPTIPGRYKAIVKTDVTDAACLSSVEQNTSKQFNVITEDPRDECYTLLNNLALSNQFPWSGETVTISFTKISNYADLDYILSPISTDITMEIIDEQSQDIVASYSETISANSDSETPRVIEYDWDTTGLDAGWYDIIVYGIGNSQLCDGKDNLNETLQLRVYLDSESMHQPDISGLPDVNFTEDSMGQHYIFDLDDYTTDPDDPDLENIAYYIVSESNANLIGCYIEDSHFISCDAPAENSWGSSVIVVEANDGNYSDRDSFVVYVEAENDRPLISNIPNIDIYEDECYSFDLDDYVIDPDNSYDELSWSYSGSQHLNVSISQGHVATVCPVQDWYGTETISFTVADPEGSSDTDSVFVRVWPQNDALSLDIPDLWLSSSVKLYDNILDLWDHVEDIDTPVEDIEFAIISQTNTSIVNCIIDDSGHYIDCYVNNDSRIGYSIVTVWATDGMYYATDSFAVVVTNNNISSLAVQLLSPNGGEVFTSGAVNITWQAYSLNGCPGGIIDGVNIALEYSGDSGQTWNTITSSTENDGIYLWDVSGLEDKPTYLVKVIATDCTNGIAYDVSDSAFTINNNAAEAAEEREGQYRLAVPRLLLRDGDILKPGQRIYIALDLDNSGDFDLSNVKASAIIPELSVWRSAGPFDLGVGDSISRTIALDIPEDAKKGIYDLRLVFQSGNVKRTKHREIVIG